MARKTTRRIEPQFGAPAPVDEIAAADDDRRARSGGDNRAGGGQKRRSGRKKPKKTARDRKSRSFLGRSFRSILYLGFACCVWGVVAVAGLVAYYAAELPGASEWKVPDRPPNIQILAVDGRLIGNRGDTGGEAVRIAELPPYVPNAVIAIEDRRFRSHFGIDPVGLMRAVAKNLFAGGVVEGGSTLTQQLAKNMFLTPERSLKRKVQEVVLSRLAGDEILQGRDPGDVPEPGLFRLRRLRDRRRRQHLFQDRSAQPDARRRRRCSPACFPPRAATRRTAIRMQHTSAQTLVLAAMTDAGFITADEAKNARDNPPAAGDYKKSGSGNYIADWVMDVLPYHVGTIEQDVVVETTVDLNLQKEAEEAVASTIAAERREIRHRRGRDRRARRHRRGARDGWRPLLRREPVQPRRRCAPSARLGIQAFRLSDARSRSLAIAPTR